MRRGIDYTIYHVCASLKAGGIDAWETNDPVELDAWIASKKAESTSISITTTHRTIDLWEEEA